MPFDATCSSSDDGPGDGVAKGVRTLSRASRQRRQRPRPFGTRDGSNSSLAPPPSIKRRLVWRGIAIANRIIPKRTRQVALHSTIDIEDGVIALIDELDLRGHHSVVLMEDCTRVALLRAVTSARFTAVKKRSLRGLVHYLVSRYVVTTENVFGDQPPPPSQTLINIWHGEPPTKITGHFYVGGGGQPATYAPVCSTIGRAYRAAEFGLSPLQVPIVGAPRNDRMMRADGQRIRRSLLGDDTDRTTFLWLPSYRTGEWAGLRRSDVTYEPHPGVPFPAEDVQQLDDWLYERGARVVVKLHPLDVARFTGTYKAIRALTQSEMESRALTLYTMLPAFDALVTDVSSVWVDHLLLDKPVVFAFPDIDEYRAGRGINLEPFEQWVPGPFTRTIQELITCLGDIVDDRDPMADERRRARARFHQYCDDGSTARLLDGLGIRADEQSGAPVQMR